jgi:hypothetical protein
MFKKIVPLLFLIPGIIHTADLWNELKSAGTRYIWGADAALENDYSIAKNAVAEKKGAEGKNWQHNFETTYPQPSDNAITELIQNFDEGENTHELFSGSGCLQVRINNKNRYFASKEFIKMICTARGVAAPWEYPAE